MINKILISVLIIFHASLNAQEAIQLVNIGQEKQEIIKALGEPNAKEQTAKSSEYIWGPEEEFWSDIPMGSKLEVWRYTNENWQLNLYFVNGSNRLSFKAFTSKGVVYESN